MAVVFHANHVSVDDMDDLWLVGFADKKFGSRDYLMLQRAYIDDEQDISLGMNTYHVERNDQRWSGYGGIRTFELFRDRVIVTFTEKGAIEMGNVSSVEITFQVGAREFAELKERLERIFAGTSCLID
jgi:hypothetical protein